MKTYEYRVAWRRRDWESNTSTKTRIFARREDAERFVGKLRGDDRPDLSPVCRLDVACREVGSWAEGWGG